MSVYITAGRDELGKIAGSRGARPYYTLCLRPFKLPLPRQWCEEGHQKTQSTARIGVNQRKYQHFASLIELVDDCWYTHTFSFRLCAVAACTNWKRTTSAPCVITAVLFHFEGGLGTLFPLLMAFMGIWFSIAYVGLVCWSTANRWAYTIRTRRIEITVIICIKLKQLFLL